MLNSILHKSIITFSFTCVFANFLGAQWVQKGVDIDGEFEQERLGAAMAMNADGNIVAVGGIGGSFGPTAALRTRVFEWSGSSWQQKGSSLTSHSTDVSLNDEGNRLAVGFDLEGEGWTFGEGVVRIFEWDGSDWIIMGDSLKGDDDDDDFGYNVELNMEGDVVVVGARNSGSGPTAPGYVKVFEWDGSSWLQKGSKIIGEAAWDEFGYRVSINDSGNVIAVGGRHNDEVANYAGHARVFQWDGSDWIQRGEDIDGEFEYDQFGSGIALDGSGNTVAIGANNSDFGSTMNCGQVRIFDWDGESWNQRGETIYGPGYQALAGSAIDMSRDGNFVAVGAHWYLSETGMVQVFMWYDNAWVQVGSDLVGEAVDDRSGHRVQLSESGYVVASSALDNDDGGDLAGHLRVYELADAGISNSEKMTFNIFPNPATDQVFLSLDGVDGLQSVRVLDCVGQEVMNLKPKNLSEGISIGLLEAGTYVIEMVSTDSEAIRKSFIKK